MDELCFRKISDLFEKISDRTPCVCLVSKSIRARAIKFPLTTANERWTAGQSGKMAVATGLCRVRLLIKSDFTRVLKYSTLANSLPLNSVSKKTQSFIYHIVQLHSISLLSMKNVKSVDAWQLGECKGWWLNPPLLSHVRKHARLSLVFLPFNTGPLVKVKSKVRCVGLFIVNFCNINNWYKWHYFSCFISNNK